MPATRLALVVAAALLLGPGPIAGKNGVWILASNPVFAGGKHRGVCYAHSLRAGRGYGSPDSEWALRRLAALGVNWISITPFAFQRSPRDTALGWSPDRFGETDVRLREVTAQAHALEIRVMLKPHVWLRPPHWPGSIEHDSESDCRAWFESYREFILHYAALAESARIDALCVGNELEKTTACEADWREIIGSVRRVYHGPLTYGATTSEAEAIKFWDALDFIGVSAYYPLVEAPSPSRADLAAAWRPHRARLVALAVRWRRPVVFTEIGYPSADFGAWKQWEVPRDARVNRELQATAYEAFFDDVWPEPWFGGAYWWKWFSHPGAGEPENQFEPKGKPAEGVLEKHYRKGAGRG